MAAFASTYQSQQTEFYVQDDDFSALEIRDAGNGSGFHYFFDTKNNKLVTDFVLDDRPRVSTLCQVTLIKKDGQYSPRFRFWKKDKTKLGKKVLEHAVSVDDTTKIIKATVDTDDAYPSFWKLIHFIESFAGVALPDNNFRIVSSDGAQLAKAFEGKNKETILEAVRLAIGGELTEEDMRLMSNRKAQLEKFDRMLRDADYFDQEKARLDKRGTEAVWQHFFEENPWIFGYGLKLVACEPLDRQKLERITTGANIFTGAGKRSDAVMRTKGYVSSLMFCEIKTDLTPLLETRPYREPDVYQVSREVSGGVSQVQKTVSKALSLLSGQLHDVYEDDGTPTGVQVSTIKPKQALVIGSLDQFRSNGGVNPEMSSSFELYRSSIQDVEIITFDELYERASFIVREG